MTQPPYVVISPVRDEEKHLGLTVRCMCEQTVRPLKWIVVNDGSSDGTGKIADEAAARHDWIQVLHRKNRGFRQAGTGVMDAFYAGFDRIASGPWRYLSKFDGDLSFGPDYFQKCLREFEADEKLGVAGGTCCKDAAGMPTEFPGDPSFHVRGPTKIYRRECFEAIGGLIKAPGWDTVDEIKANMLGWTSKTFPHIRLVHHRPTGGAAGCWRDSMKNGLANYITGYHPLFMAIKCLRRSARRPYFKEGLGLWVGFLSGYVKRSPRVGDAALIRYLRGQQWRALTLRESLWSQGPVSRAGSPPG